MGLEMQTGGHWQTNEHKEPQESRSWYRGPRETFVAASDGRGLRQIQRKIRKIAQDVREKSKEE